MKGVAIRYPKPFSRVVAERTVTSRREWAAGGMYVHTMCTSDLRGPGRGHATRTQPELNPSRP